MAIRNLQSVLTDAERDAVVPIKNPLSPGLIYHRGNDLLQVYEPDAAAWRNILPTYLADQTRPLSLRQSFTTAQWNAGVTLLAALAGYKYQLVDFTLTAVGGNAATATSVRITGVQATSTVQLVTVAVAALTRSTAVKPNSANVTLLADGAWSAPCDANTAITGTVDNNNLATATAIIADLQYLIIPA